MSAIKLDRETFMLMRHRKLEAYEKAYEIEVTSEKAKSIGHGTERSGEREGTNHQGGDGKDQ